MHPREQLAPSKPLHVKPRLSANEEKGLALSGAQLSLSRPAAVTRVEDWGAAVSVQSASERSCSFSLPVLVLSDCQQSVGWMGFAVVVLSRNPRDRRSMQRANRPPTVKQGLAVRRHRHKGLVRRFQPIRCRPAHFPRWPCRSCGFAQLPRHAAARPTLTCLADSLCSLPPV